MTSALRGTSAGGHYILYLMLTYARAIRILHKTFAFAWPELHGVADVPGGTTRGDPRCPAMASFASASRRHGHRGRPQKTEYNTVAGIANSDLPTSFT